MKRRHKTSQVLVGGCQDLSALGTVAATEWPQLLNPAYWSLGYRFTLSHLIFQASSGKLPPTAFCPIAAKGVEREGVSQLKLPPGWYRTIAWYRQSWLNAPLTGGQRIHEIEGAQLKRNMKNAKLTTQCS